MANAFERFKQRNQMLNGSNKDYNKSFVLKGYASTTMISDADETVEHLAYVYNKQEKDEGYIYTLYDEPLEIGSCWNVKGLHFLIDEEIIIIKDVAFRKYHALLCNIESAGTWWYFKKDDYIDVSLRDNAFIKSLAKPLLVTPGTPFGYGDKVKILNKVWLIQEYDNYSHPGITYYSITASTISKELLETEEPYELPIIEPAENIEMQEDPEESEHIIIPNQVYTLSTEDGYFRTSSNLLKVVSRTSSSVQFTIPFGVSEVTVSVKQGGEIVDIVYREE